ncbi:MAG TPA: hypothetical protein VLA11_04940 [Woeseiaceae bacterium]|jgi:hypothetical protein|nr:hypothetical protein [Woeseiaceae bacterium]
MTIDPKLLALFTEAQQVFDQDAFAREVLARIDAERRRTVLLWAGLGFIALVALALLAAPVTTALGMATELLPATLFELETGWLELLLSPINSIAAAIAIGALALRKFYRSIFG